MLFFRPGWDLPGGAVEAEESPQAACRREVAEENGLDRLPGRVLAVDWVPSRRHQTQELIIPEGLNIVFDGGTLTSADIGKIVLADGELARFEFTAPAEVASRVSPLIARRVAACLDALAAGTVVSLENGSAALRSACRNYGLG
jgi:8-oxo-dGTP diphosphatase